MSSSSSNGKATGANRIRYLAIALLILLPLAALGSRFGLWPFTVGLLLATVSVAGCVLIQIINAIWLLRKPQPATRTALRWACLFALPPVALFASILGNQSGGAMIHNISTDTVNPPAFVAAIAERGEHSNPLTYTEDIAAAQKQAYPDLQSIESGLEPQQAFQRALAVATQLGWEIYAQSEQEGRIEAVETTLWFGFKDDIVIRIEPTEAGGSRLDLRSVSRVGKGDLGANANRIRAFRETFNSDAAL